MIFINNSAGCDGGAVWGLRDYAWNSSIDNCTFKNNKAMETRVEQILSGDVFIIPNGLVAPSNIYVYGEDNLPYKEVWAKKNEKYRETRDYYLKVSDIKEFSDSAGLVEVWCATPGPDDSNWSWTARIDYWRPSDR